MRTALTVWKQEVIRTIIITTPSGAEKKNFDHLLFNVFVRRNMIGSFIKLYKYDFREERTQFMLAKPSFFVQRKIVPIICLQLDKKGEDSVSSLRILQEGRTGFSFFLF
jgi:hypothetical protein